MIFGPLHCTTSHWWFGKMAIFHLWWSVKICFREKILGINNLCSQCTGKLYSLFIERVYGIILHLYSLAYLVQRLLLPAKVDNYKINMRQGLQLWITRPRLGLSCSSRRRCRPRRGGRSAGRAPRRGRSPRSPRSWTGRPGPGCPAVTHHSQETSNIHNTVGKASSFKIKYTKYQLAFTQKICQEGW